MNHRLAIVTLLVWMIAAAPAAAEMTDQQAVDSAEKALGGSVEFPWYDGSDDTLRRVDVQPPAPPPKPREWTPNPNPAQPNLGWLWRLFKWAFWGGLLAGLLLLLYLLLRSMLRGVDVPPAGGDMTTDVKPAATIERIERLPFAIKRPRSDLLASAQAAYQQGDFNEAIVYLFSYQLLQLDRHELIRLTKGKTNRQYLREMRRNRSVLELVQQTMVPFEDAFFGGRTLDRSRFESCWNRLDEFHQCMQQASA